MERETVLKDIISDLEGYSRHLYRNFVRFDNVESLKGNRIRKEDFNLSQELCKNDIRGRDLIYIFFAGFLIPYDRLLKKYKDNNYEYEGYLIDLERNIRRNYYHFNNDEEYAGDFKVAINKIKGDFLKIDIDDNLKKIVSDNMKPEYWILVSEIIVNMPIDLILENILHFEKLFFERVVSYKKYTYLSYNLYNMLLNVSDGDSVLDINMCINSQMNDFNLNSSDIMNTKRTKIVEKKYVRDVFDIKNFFLKIDTTVIEGNIFECDLKDKYDKIYGLIDTGRRVRHMNLDLDKLLKKYDVEKYFQYTASMEWIYSLEIIDRLKDGGIGAIIIPNGLVGGTINESCRKFFIKNKFIKAVISLPEGVFSNTSIKTTMIIFKKNSEYIRFIDASELLRNFAGNRFYGYKPQEISSIDKHIDKLRALLNSDSTSRYCVNIPPSVVLNNDNDLNPLLYTVPRNISCGDELGDNLKSVKSGMVIRLEGLGEYVSDTETKLRYVTLSNIENGLANIEGQYLKEFPDKTSTRHIITKRSIIMSRGLGNTMGVIEPENGEKYLAIGNLYALEVDESKINTYYLFAFLNSSKGRSLMNKLSGGSIAKVISIKQLKKIVVPKKSLEEQRKIEDNFKSTLESINILQSEINKKKKVLYELF